MSKFVPGMLVMLNYTPLGNYTSAPTLGSIGEVVDSSGKDDWYVKAGCSVVSFPRNISPHPTGLWQYSNNKLTPISDPGIGVGQDESVTKYVEDLV